LKQAQQSSLLMKLLQLLTGSLALHY